MKKSLFFTFLISFSLITLACSSSEIDEFEDEEGAIYEEFEEGEEADRVGSIPEDDAELLNEFAEGGEGDPFSDLKDEEEKQEEMADSGMDMSGGDGSMVSYTIVRGDTLMKIAFEIYGNVDRWRDLLNWNRNVIGSVQALRPGTTIRYSNLGTWSRPRLPYSYNIRPGDTLGGIAKNIYGNVMKYKKLQEYNSRLIKDPNLIYAGFDLYYDLTTEEQNSDNRMHLGDSSFPDKTISSSMEEEMAEPIATAVQEKESSTE